MDVQGCATPKLTLSDILIGPKISKMTSHKEDAVVKNAHFCFIQATRKD